MKVVRSLEFEKEVIRFSSCRKNR